MIRRSTFASGLYPESTYPCHLFSRSDGLDLLRIIRRSTFTSGLYPEFLDPHHMSSRFNDWDSLRLSGLREFQFSNSRFFQRDFSEMADRLPCVLLDQRFCSHFRTLVLSTKSTILQLSSQSTVEISFCDFSSSLSTNFWSCRSRATYPPWRWTTPNYFGTSKLWQVPSPAFAKR
jgi:hypothetical protein